MISSLKIWRASLMLKQSEGFLSQKKHWCAPWYSTMHKEKQTRCGYSRRSKHFALAQNSKAAFINTQSTYLVKANNHDNWQANRQKSPEEQFCFVFPGRLNSLLGLGNWWSWQFPLQQLTNQIWTRICIPTVFLFCHGMLTWLRQEFRPRIVKRNIYAYAGAGARLYACGWPVAMRIWTIVMCSYIIFFKRKNPQKSVTRWSWTCK
jgi:hypothetical protein